MLLAVSPARATFDHQCERCHVARQGLRIDPAHGEITITSVDGVPGNLCVPCPCGTVELFRLDIAPHEAGEGHHPRSLVGTRFADTQAVVSAHDVDGSGHPAHQEQCRHILALARHPHLAAQLLGKK